MFPSLNERSNVRRRAVARLAVLAGVAGGLVFVPVSPAAAVTVINVTTTGDVVNPSDGVVSLREAISSIVTDGTPEEIRLAASGVYEISLSCGTQEHLNAGGDFDVMTSDDVTITGTSSAAKATIRLGAACTNQRLLYAGSTSTLTLRNLILEGGSAADATGSDIDGADGGAIYTASSPLVLEDVDLIDNSAGDAGRAISSYTHGGHGGAIYVGGDLTMTRVTATGNRSGDGYLTGTSASDSSGGDGGVLYTYCGSCSIEIVDSTFEDNRTGDGGASSGNGGGYGGDGGALSLFVGSLDISGSVFRNNTTGDAGDLAGLNARDGGEGGAIKAWAPIANITDSEFDQNGTGDGATGPQSSGNGGWGGAASFTITSGTATVTFEGTTFTDNYTGRGGDSTATSGSPSAGRGGLGGALIGYSDELTFVVVDCTFSGNAAGDGGDYLGVGATAQGGAGGPGGAIYLAGALLNVKSSVFDGNSAGDVGASHDANTGVGGGGGGAIYADTFGLDRAAVSIETSLFKDNVSGAGGSLNNPASGDGGAIVMISTAPKGLDISGSTFVGNMASMPGGLPNSRGGAIVSYNVPVNIAGSIFHDNTSDGAGGALSVRNGAMTITNSTITENLANSESAMELWFGGTATVSGTIFSKVSGDSVNLCPFSGITSAGYNAELGGATCTALSDATDLDNVPRADLGEYGDNGPADGYSSRVPAPGGDLVDAIPAVAALCTSAVEARGVTRPLGDGCDIGATELVTTVTAVDDTDGAFMGEDLVVSVLANDTVTSDDTSFAAETGMITDVSSATLGSVVVDGDTLRYTPATVGEETITYTVCNVVETTVCDTADVTITIVWNEMFEAVTPTRLVDTRVGQTSELSVSKTKVGLVPRSFAIDDSAVIPDSGVAAVSLNVTAVGAAAVGYLSVYPCGPVPSVSSLNYTVGGATGNAVLVPLSELGSVCVSSSQPVDVIIDVQGYLRTGSGFSAVTPTRLVDTRVGQSSELSVTKTKVGPTPRTFVLEDSALIPDSGVAAVSLNVTAVGAPSVGYLSVYPCGVVPTVSSLNYISGAARGNAVLVPLSASGSVCVVSSQSVDVILDVQGWIADETYFEAVTPTRLVDTRASGTGELSVSKTKVGPTPRTFVLEDSAVIPDSGVAAVSLNVTAVGAAAVGYLSVYPCGPVPSVSSLNYTVGGATGNAVLVPLSGSGAVCVSSSQPVDVIIDVQAWIAAPAP